MPRADASDRSSSPTAPTRWSRPRSAIAAGPARRAHDRPDWRDGALRVRQLRRAVQSRQRALVRAGAAGRGLRRDERSALRLERGPEEPRAWCVRAEAGMIQLASRLPSSEQRSSRSCRGSRPMLGAINLSQGFPDFDCDPALIEAVARHMRAGRNQYAPMPGVLALREAIAGHVPLVVRTGLRSGNGSHDHLWRDGGDLRRDRRLRAPGRRSDRPRAVLRLVRARPSS